jgi:hypothetical protein
MVNVRRPALSIALILAGCANIFADGLTPVTAPEPAGVDWAHLYAESGIFLGIEHGFRWVTEEGTRHPHTSFFGGYVDSLNGLHGWADGDPFLVNYVGHPMQGAVTGFLFVQNDRQYRTVRFGKNRRYWKSRLRAAGFAWAYSEQFELGPLSEASIGNTQAFFPQQGFADQVATPALGFAWMIAEDAADRYVVERVEARVHNQYARLLLRSGLNPSRSMANMIGGRAPWYRDSRSGIRDAPRLAEPSLSAGTSTPTAVPTFEFLATSRVEAYLGEHSRSVCVGGGAALAFRVAAHWQVVGDVGGCKLTSFGANLSGDSLTYLIGPRWTATPLKRWNPYVQVLVGGRTVAHEEIDPAKKALVAANLAKQGKTLDFVDHPLYTRASEVTGLAVSAHVGLDIKLTSAIAFRMADLGYTHSWHSGLDDIRYTHSLQFTSGLILRFGTW